MCIDVCALCVHVYTVHVWEGACIPGGGGTCHDCPAQDVCPMPFPLCAPVLGGQALTRGPNRACKQILAPQTWAWL